MRTMAPQTRRVRDALTFEFRQEGASKEGILPWPQALKALKPDRIGSFRCEVVDDLLTHISKSR